MESKNPNINEYHPDKQTFSQRDILESDKQEPKTIIKYRERRNGLFGSGIGCSTLGCGCLLFLAIICVGVIYVIVNRPPSIWSGVVSYLNRDLVLPKYTPASTSFVEESISSNIKNGQNDIYITEDQFTTIAREQFPQFTDLRFDIEKDILKMYWALDNSEDPVYAKISLVKDGESIKIVQAGTSSVSIPEFTNQALNNILLSLLRLNGGEGEGGFINTLFSNGSSLKINNIEFQPDRLYLDIFVDITLFN